MEQRSDQYQSEDNCWDIQGNLFAQNSKYPYFLSVYALNCRDAVAEQSSAGFEAKRIQSHILIWPLSSSLTEDNSLFFFFIFFKFYGCTHWKFPGQGLNPSHRCDLTTAVAKPDPLVHCVGTGSKPHLHSNPSCCSWILNPLLHSRNSSVNFLNTSFPHLQNRNHT